jgi:hypothetical protein
MATHNCRNCGKEFESSQGLRTHYTRKEECRDAVKNAAAALPPTEIPSSDAVIPEDDDTLSHDPWPVQLDVDMPPISPSHSPPRPPPSPTNPPPPKRARVEDVLDEDDRRDQNDRFVAPYPGSAGKPVKKEKVDTPFEELRKARGVNVNKHHPLASEDEWKFVQWLMKSGVTHKSLDDLMKLNMVSTLLKALILIIAHPTSRLSKMARSHHSIIHAPSTRQLMIFLHRSTLNGRQSQLLET